MFINYITNNIINGKRYVGMHYVDDVTDKYLGKKENADLSKRTPQVDSGLQNG